MNIRHIINALLVIGAAKGTVIDVYPPGYGSAGSTALNAAALDDLQQAVSMAQDRRSVGEDVTILLHEGRHALSSPLTFTSLETISSPTGSSSNQAPQSKAGYLTITSAPGEHASVSGGVPVTGWAYNNTTNLWEAALPSAVNASSVPQSFILDGVRQTRARHPNKGSYLYKNGTFSDGWAHTAFIAREGDVSPSWYDLTSVQMLIYFAWTASRNYVHAIFPNNTVLMSNPSQYPIGQFDEEGASGLRYWIDNLLEGCDTDGEWYIDQPKGLIYYHAPAPPAYDMNAHEAILPILTTVMDMNGQTGIGVHNVTIADGDFICDSSMMCDGQSTSWSPAGAVEVLNSSHITFQDVEFRSLGLYPIWIHGGSSDILLDHCWLHDLGDGGVRIGDMDDTGAVDVTVSNCTITDGGQAFPSGTGVLIHRAGDVAIVHNLISNLSYTGVAAGWTWGFSDYNATYGIEVGWNRIDTIARYELSDLGGVYTLGYQQGSRVHNNWISNVFSYDYGGWGLYTDEGSTGILWDSNLVHDTKAASLHQHYGTFNTFFNNILAFGAQDPQNTHPQTDSGIRNEGEDDNGRPCWSSFNFTRNIVYFDSGCLFEARLVQQPAPQAENYTFGLNMYYTPNNALTYGYPPIPNYACGTNTFAAWQADGYDVTSVSAVDPQFANPGARNFTLSPSSYAVQKLGFVPLDLSIVGPISSTYPH